ncbi:MAG: hypothetical protein F6K38_40195 [Moorea sp. SIO3B2]|nr:hypothetical protein [Moorena sp. SIO3B2]NEP70265.1 hypothetical protein [Moorena sp. SIO3A5]
MLLFVFYTNYIHTLMPAMYGWPVEDYEKVKTYKNIQVKLFFSQLTIDDRTKRPLWKYNSQITFRLVDETTETFTEAKAKALAEKIYKTLVNPQMHWNKGKIRVSYNDDQGYRFSLDCKDEAEGKRVMRQIMSIQGHTMEEGKTRVSKIDGGFPNNPGTHKVYGKITKKVSQRPEVKVEFTHAVALVWSKGEPVGLVGPRHKLRSAFFRF